MAVLALDIGGTKLAAGVVEDDGAVLAFRVAPSAAARGPQDTLARLFALGREAIAAAGPGAPVAAVGIGCGGPLDRERGVLVAPPHLPGWRDVPVVAMAWEAFALPAALENDATAAAAGEHRWGRGAGRRHLVYLTISTGVGGGIVVDGRLYRGAAGNGGELGHVTVDRHGRTCRGCGRRGCLEAYASGTSIAERAVEALAAAEPGAPPSTLAAVGAPSAADVAAAARDGDRLAARVWDETCDALACGLTSLVNVLEPELVVLGGGVTRAGEQLLAPVRARVGADAMGPAAAAVRIEPSAFGDRVGVMGAAAIAAQPDASSPHAGARPRDFGT